MDIVCCVMLAQQHRTVATDHLGNVRATVSDMLLPRGSGVFDADLRTLTDYYPFGMTMPERSYEAAGINGHRYGYNGKENDNEVKGEGNQQDYGFRIYDPRVARFLSVDPLAPDYPWYTPYQFAGNTPIQAIDLDGLEPEAVVAKASEYIGTPYEFGGKKPAMKGGYPVWMPKASYLAFIGYPSSAMSSVRIDRVKWSFLSFGSSAANECKLELTDVANFQALFNTKDCGIDCSGLARLAFNADKLKKIPNMGVISANAMKSLLDEKARGDEPTAVVGNDMSLVQEGDLVFSPNHVMIATGQTRNSIRKGGESVLEFEVIHAPQTGREVIREWKRATDKHSWGRPVRNEEAKNTAGSSE